MCVRIANPDGAKDDRQGAEDDADVVDERDPAQDHGDDAADTTGDPEPVARREHLGVQVERRTIEDGLAALAILGPVEQVVLQGRCAVFVDGVNFLG